MAIEVDEATVTLSLQGQSGDRPVARAFGAGDRVADRYVVVRFLAEGRMGEVYEAIDEELHDRVALKTVRSASATDEQARVGLRREVHLARKVTHENVCRLFDLGFHGDTMFFTMEHLAGEILAQRLQRVGRLSPSGALPIAEGIAAGLDAAHQSGVVHGDLKPGNVMLVPSRDGERVVVTDFGIASRREPHDDHALVDARKRVAGSPGYMAPEKRDTGETTTSGDIYSFGVLLYRMVTGVLPFTMGARDGKPARPRAYVPDLDPRWKSAILRCLERNPAARFSRAGEVIQAVRAPARPRRRLIPLAFVAVTIGAAAPAWWWGRPAPAPTRSQRSTVAVLGLHNQAGRAEDVWLSPAIGEMLTMELSAGSGLRTVPRSLVTPVERELGLVGPSELGTATLTDLGERLGARLILTGSYVASGEELQLDMEIRVARTGRTVFAGQYQGSWKNLEGVVGRAAGDIRAKLDVGAPSATERAVARVSVPADADAARHYSEGLERVRRFEYAAAIVALERAAAADPAFAPTQAALADAHWFLGNEDAARGAAKRALDLAEGETDRLFAQARYWQTVGQSRQAVAVLDRVVESRKVMRLGEVRERPIDIRIVAATNRDLEEEAGNGRFRQDLFFRLSTAIVRIPPLRERPRELLLLARKFLEEAAERMGRPPLRLEENAVAALLRYPWPGNVRELRNIIEFSVASAVDDVIDVHQLAPRILADAVAEPIAAPPDPSRGLSVQDEVRELEKRRTIEALASCDGNQSRAAALIGMPRRTFVAKLKQYRIRKGPE